MASMDIDDSPTTPNMAITPVTDDTDETPVSVEQPNKRRRKKSIVWEHFTIETVGAGCMRACCKQCKKSFAYITGSKLAGTSHLKRHIALGICPVSRQKNEASQIVSGVKSDPPKRRYRSSPAVGSIPFDQDRCNQDVAKMIIQHDYPLHIVEHPAFVGFVRTLQPQYNMVSFNTIQGECVSLYLREKQGLMDLISGIPGRVSISLDLRTSNLNVGYAFLTGHFIDSDWNLHRCLLNVVMLPFPESEYAFNQAVISCISDWHLESRLFTLTLDQSISNDNIIGNLRGVLSVKNQLMFNGQLVKGNCYARVLSRLAQEALGATGEVVRRIRESVKYVKTSDSHDEKFAELRQRLQVPSTRELIIDDQTKWDTTYHMLVAACELKEVFSCLDTTDPLYKINPSMDDWKQGEILCTYLKLFYDAACILTGPMYPPSNAFYHEVSKIQLELTHAAMSQDPFVSSLARPLKDKFDQYWRDCFLVLAIAIVMDPRFKMKLVEFSFSRIFGEDAGMWIKIVDDGIHELFLDYLPPHLSVPNTYMEAGNTSISQAEIFQEAPHQEEVAQEASFQEHEEVIHHADVATHGVDSQGTTIQGLQSEEITPLEQPTEELVQAAHGVDSQGATIEELQPEEITSLEQPKEGLVQHPSPEEKSQEAAEQMDSQEAAEQMDSQEAATQEMLSQEAATQDMNGQVETTQEMNGQVAATQEMNSEEVPPKEMDNQEEPAHQMVIQDDTMHNAEFPVQEKHVEVGPLEVNNNKEVLTEEVLAEGRVPTEGIQAQEMTEKTQDQENVSHEMKAQAEPITDMHVEENMTSEMHVQEKSNPEMHSQEKPTQEVDAPENLTEDVPVLEKPTEEVNALEEPAEDVNALEKSTDENMHVEEVQTQEMQASEVQTSQEVVDQDMKLTEGETEENKVTEGQDEENKIIEGNTEEMKMVERQNKEMKHAGGETEEMEHAGQTEEIQPSEAQAEKMHSEVQTEYVQPSEPQTEEMQPSEPQTESAEVQSSEGQTKDMQSAEVQTEVQTSETQSQERQPSSEGLTEEMQSAEGKTQERQPSEGQDVEMQSAEQVEETQTAEGETQETETAEEQTQDPQPVEEQDEEMQSAEQETQIAEGQTQETETVEGQIQETQPVEGQDEEMNVREENDEETQPVEGQAEEMKMTEEDDEEKQPAGEISEMHPAEGQIPEMQPQEGQAQEMHPSEAQTQEMHPPSQEESQQMNPPEAQTRETHEMHISEEQAQEMQPQEQEMQPQEQEIDQLQSQESETHQIQQQLDEAQAHQMQLQAEQEQAHEMQQLQEAHNHEMQLGEAQNHEMQTQDMHFQEVEYHDQHHQHEAIHNEEMHSQGIQEGQEMDYEAMSHEMHTQDLPLLSIGDGLQDFEVYISEIANSQHLKSELDQYLEESLLPRVQDFDVLGWWKLNKLKYPTLSKMAADILSIPVSTVAPESVFEIRSKKIDSYQSSLRPVTLEALICAKDWLHYGSSSSSSSSSSLDMSNALVKMEY
ncbi:Zinc finger BED domain-containing protein RICESLEEPER 2 [Euphorbia peplus]|nr:Zinc finger BED domain-containing protein RICESLEEPER 2 [Euphorbia peplus]